MAGFDTEVVWIAGSGTKVVWIASSHIEIVWIAGSDSEVVWIAGSDQSQYFYQMNADWLHLLSVSITHHAETASYCLVTS